MLKSSFLLGLVGLVSLPTLAAGIEGGPYIGAGLGVYQDSDTDGAGNLDAESMGYSLTVVTNLTALLVSNLVTRIMLTMNHLVLRCFHQHRFLLQQT